MEDDLLCDRGNDFEGDYVLEDDFLDDFVASTQTLNYNPAFLRKVHQYP